jgi:hypothetical protein
MSSCKNTLFHFFESSNAGLYVFFFLQHGLKDFYVQKKFWIYIFKEHISKGKQVVKGKQGQVGKQAILVFFIYNRFEIWFLAEGQILEIFEPKQARHFPSNIF